MMPSIPISIRGPIDGCRPRLLQTHVLFFLYKIKNFIIFCKTKPAATQKTSQFIRTPALNLLHPVFCLY